ncbi:flagellar protein FlaG [Planococcus halotolerans]|uniref:Flagellar protein FlaG n=1 Tax=Planococcus halotolerans TaxID=2233542 RepID=A0A365KQW1_9BACL|nr:flagellar protein FlaG [Planococcus halotolerans]QHJ69582.1 flagellar protein FlaG [Planococcus halotolerans]RAZ75531.1 flagellar protein FlaG [Planococcus halotolerans]
MEVKSTPVIPIFKSNETVVIEPIKIQVKSETPIQKEEIHQEQITKEMVQNQIEGMNEFLEPTTTAVKFLLHEDLNEYYVQVINPLTDEVLKEIPNKKFLDMYASMTELMGLIVDEKK